MNLSAPAALQGRLFSLREGLEAVLVIAIILSFLKRTGMEELGRFVWYGVFAASLLCITAGSLLFSLAGSLSDEAGEVFEITVTFMAAGMLTFMIVWMKRHGQEVKSGMELKARRASRSASPVAISLLAFATVGREGLETVLFLQANASASGPGSTITGAIAGFSTAAITGVALYKGVYHLNLKKFFDITGILLMIFAAGIIGNAVHEIVSSGILPAVLSEPVWNTGALLSHRDGFGAVLHSLFGYRADPDLLQVISYWLYLGIMTWVYFRPRLGWSRLGRGLLGRG